MCCYGCDDQAPNCNGCPFLFVGSPHCVVPVLGIGLGAACVLFVVLVSRVGRRMRRLIGVLSERELVSGTLF